MSTDYGTLHLTYSILTYLVTHLRSQVVLTFRSPSRDAVKDGREVVETESEKNFRRELFQLHHELVRLVRRVQKLATPTTTIST